MTDLRQGGTGCTWTGTRRAWSVVGALLLVAALSGSGGAAAGEGKTPPAERLRPVRVDRAVPEQDGFYRGNLLPGLARQLDALAPFQGLPTRSAPNTGHLVHDEACRLARLRARRGAERALKEYLVASTPLGRLVDSVEPDRRDGGPGSSRASRVGLTVRRGRPVVELRRTLGGGLLRAGMSLDGRLRLEYRGGPFVGAGLRAEYDARRRELQASCRLAF